MRVPNGDLGVFMFPKLLLLSLFISTSAFSQSWKRITSKTFTIGTAGSPLTTCPTNYVLVPKLIGYTTSDFCVAKYEMKLSTVTGEAVSQAAGAPYASISRDNAINACRSRGGGYELINNDQWQTIAKNIAGVAVNWSSGTVYVGSLNKGHSDGTPASAQVASVDTDPCYLTGQTCSTAVWNSQRRTFVLSTGEVLWDFVGNVSEWVINPSTVSPGANGLVASYNPGDTREVLYGHNIPCDDYTNSPFCNYGSGYFGTAGAIHRGSAFGDNTNAGIFYANLQSSGTATSANVGFRCVFQP